jgi:hypothetical protein
MIAIAILSISLMTQALLSCTAADKLHQNPDESERRQPAYEIKGK